LAPSIAGYPFIALRSVTTVYPLAAGGEVTALRGVDLTIARGEYLALVGPNGSGKSTLARHLNGLLLPTHGEVWVDGLLTADPDPQTLWRVRQRVGYVWQNPDNQLVGSTVEEDVAFGPENQGLPPDEIRRRVDQALAIVDMADYRRQPPSMLSGGQKQRVAIAAALASLADCIVFDEPTSMLDARGQGEIMGAIQRLNREQALTVILITHSMDEAAMAQRVVVMGGGRIVLDAPPHEVFERGAELRALCLDLPPVVEVAHALRAQGLRLPLGILTVEGLVAALC
jgi:energy-coupling factor transport system ATP-binding protein